MYYIFNVVNKESPFPLNMSNVGMIAGTIVASKNSEAET